MLLFGLVIMPLLYDRFQIVETLAMLLQMSGDLMFQSFVRLVLPPELSAAVGLSA